MIYNSMPLTLNVFISISNSKKTPTFCTKNYKKHFKEKINFEKFS